SARQLTSPSMSTLDLIEGFHLAHAVAALHDLGVLRSLAMPCSTSELADRHNLAPQILGPMLELVARRTELLQKRADLFATTEYYDAVARFQLDQYIGAYGPNARGVI